MTAYCFPRHAPNAWWLTTALTHRCLIRRRAFQPLVDAGFVEVVYGAGDIGKFLCQHPLVASVHLTGSSTTFDAIVWGDNKAKVGSAAIICVTDLPAHSRSNAGDICIPIATLT